MKKLALIVTVAVTLAVAGCAAFENYKAPEEPFPNCVGCYSNG